MDYLQTTGVNRSRTSATDRSNQDRYFHVMGQGWYVLTREGIRGPKVTRERATEFLKEQISGQESDGKKESWRYRPI